MKIIKTIKKLLYTLIISTLVIIALGIIISTFNITNGYKLFTVQSGSMEPRLHIGSLIVVKPVTDYEKDDIITFRSSEFKESLENTVTHRINEVVTNDNGKVLFKTKGDANNTTDSVLIPKDLIIGKLFLSIPYLGYPVSYSKTKEGLIILVVVPATILIYSEILTLKKETLKLIQERKKRKLTTIEKVEEKVGEEIIEVEKDIRNRVKKITNKK